MPTRNWRSRLAPTPLGSCSGRAARARSSHCARPRSRGRLPPFVTRVGVFVDATAGRRRGRRRDRRARRGAVAWRRRRARLRARGRAHSESRHARGRRKPLRRPRRCRRSSRRSSTRWIASDAAARVSAPTGSRAAALARRRARLCWPAGSRPTMCATRFGRSGRGRSTCRQASKRVPGSRARRGCGSCSIGCGRVGRRHCEQCARARSSARCSAGGIRTRAGTSASSADGSCPRRSWRRSRR